MRRLRDIILVLAGLLVGIAVAPRLRLARAQPKAGAQLVVPGVTYDLSLRSAVWQTADKTGTTFYPVVIAYTVTGEPDKTRSMCITSTGGFITTGGCDPANVLVTDGDVLTAAGYLDSAQQNMTSALSLLAAKGYIPAP